MPSLTAARVARLWPVCAAVVGLCGWRSAPASELPLSAMTAAAVAAAEPIAIRVQWGGGKPQAWAGTIAVVEEGDASARAAAWTDWRTLCTEPDAATMMHEHGPGIVVHEPRPLASDGVELLVAAAGRSRLRVQLAVAGGRQPATTIDVPISELLANPVQRPLDGEGNRITIRPTGAALHVVVEGGAAEPDGVRRGGTIRRPGERVRFRVEPLLWVKPAHEAVVELRLRLKSMSQGEVQDVQATTLVPRDAGAAGAADGERRLTRFEPVVFDATLPMEEGACDIGIEAVERGSLRWTKPLATRTVQIAVVDDRPAADRPEAEWKLVHEVDPGSPRLHERLRRLPGLSGGAMPAIPLPSMPLPSITRPSMPLPKLPNVPIPSVSAMVPRLSGLLASGDSLVEAHPLGPMLRLPPAGSFGQPTWEGIVIAGAQPGTPHAVEIEYPLDQEAIVGVNVLEVDAAGVVVESRHGSGFEVRKDHYSDGRPRLATHRFVFWPTTRNPVVLLSNPSTRSPAVFGRVRILAGPERLSAARPGAGGQVGASPASRRVYAFFPGPEFSAWGGTERVDPAGGRSFADWATHLAGIRHSAEWLASQSVAGALVPVYAEGAALWPSPLTRHAPRWGSGSTTESGLDPVPKDLLDLLCRVYASAGLRFVPAMAFDAPLPALEAILACGGPEADGVACVGRDGRPRKGGRGGSHYNVLDPRVQQAVEAHVVELAARLRGAAAVDGIALLLPHDGWLHLPGVAWGLDDATFARFLASVGAREPAADGDRFARRAEMVEGPLRDHWLEWRADEVAALHARLANALARHDPRWSLHVVPTTLFAAGDLAGRLRPQLAAGPVTAADCLREAGLDPLRSTAHPQVVFVTPHVHEASDNPVDRSLVAAANASSPLVRAATEARRHGIAIVEQPLEVDPRAMVPHGPFGNATAAAGCQVRVVPTGAEADRGLAESLAAADAEVVFDMRLALCGAVQEAPSRLAFETFPAQQCAAVPGLPVPVTIRTRSSEGVTRVQVVNAADAAGTVMVGLEGAASAVVDAVDRSHLPVGQAGVVAVPIGPWSVRSLIVDGGVAVRAARMEYDAGVTAKVAARIQDLRRRRAVLEMPVPMEGLDNPGFELGGDGGPRGSAAVTGWELVEPRRGTLGLVPGVRTAAGQEEGMGLAFSSLNGLSTLRSNPFAPPPTGRVSVAVWLRINEGDPQPPLRIAVEGVEDEREYYRFAAVGGLAGARPLTAEWSQFVLPVDDLPTTGLKSLRVRFDLLGPGSVQIDDVRVFDLAFEESQRVQLSRLLAQLEQQLAARDVGACLRGLDGHWLGFLAEFVSDAAVARLAAVPTAAPPATAAPDAGRQPAGMLDRVRSWWQ